MGVETGPETSSISDTPRTVDSVKSNITINQYCCKPLDNQFYSFSVGWYQRRKWDLSCPSHFGHSASGVPSDPPPSAILQISVTALKQNSTFRRLWNGGTSYKQAIWHVKTVQNLKDSFHNEYQHDDHVNFWQGNDSGAIYSWILKV